MHPQISDTGEYLKPSSLAALETDANFTEHIAAHISSTYHHPTGAPEPPKLPYALFFHPPTGYWTATESALFFRALSAHFRHRPDLIAASITTKFTADVAVYLSLLCDGDSSSGPTAITRDLHPASHEVSAALVALEEKHAVRICAEEPSRAQEAEREARAEAAREDRNGMSVRCGEGAARGVARDREGQDARREAFERWCEEREVVWAREDMLGI